MDFSSEILQGGIVMQRTPAVAHQFYPGNPSALDKTISELIPEVADSDKLNALAVISPHAGYVYSGSVAGETFSRIKIPRDVIILGPNHHGHGSPAAIEARGEWVMPMGNVPINEKLAKLLLEKTKILVEDDLPHRYEHSIEVQIPFLQYLQEELSIIPITLSHLDFTDCERLGRELAEAITTYQKPVLIVASSDMTHYESRESATLKDKKALDAIIALDPERLYRTVHENRITMCGVIPATTAISASINMNGAKASLVRYTDSGETSGDTRQVVGYAGVVIS